MCLKRAREETGFRNTLHRETNTVFHKESAILQEYVP
jgi:hypothetical protein